MFIRKDRCLTDITKDALLFDTVEEAKDYAKAWRLTDEVVNNVSVELSLVAVTVTVKYVIGLVGEDLESL